MSKVTIESAGWCGDRGDPRQSGRVHEVPDGSRFVGRYDLGEGWKERWEPTRWNKFGDAANAVQERLLRLFEKAWG